MSFGRVPSETYPPSPVTTTEAPYKPRPIPGLADTGADIATPLIGGTVLLALGVAVLATVRAFTKER
jgi:hypothetical protein